MADLPMEMSVADLAQWRAESRRFQLIDVRENWERDIVAVADAVALPMAEVPTRLDAVARDVPVVVMCHHGGRSMRVTQWLRQQGYANAVNLAGGIDSYARELDPSLPTY